MSAFTTYTFEELATAPLYIDCIYQGGSATNLKSEVISKLVGCQNKGGFRIVVRTDAAGRKEKLPAFVVLVTSNKEPEWPDFLDPETGIFHYYGDNREAGSALSEKPGNRVLEKVFGLLHQKRFSDIPPFLIFRLTGKGRDVQFLGLAAPSNPKLSSDQDLVAFWRTMDNRRFQNYEAYFTILDTSNQAIPKEWLNALKNDHANSLKYAPEAWKKFVEKGRNGIKALKAPVIDECPSREAQTACDTEEGRQCVQTIHQFFKDSGNYYGFEACAADIVSMMDNHFTNFQLTRPWRDGGRDALGYFQISTGANVNKALKIDCALEAKCYSLNKAVGVREMSRLISRIRYRQFGVMVTTSYVHKQAYQEIIEDGHPILVVSARDIAKVLIDHSINTSNVREWIEGCLTRYSFNQAL